jgi:hypothetical protein
MRLGMRAVAPLPGTARTEIAQPTRDFRLPPKADQRWSGSSEAILGRVNSPVIIRQLHLMGQ